METKRFPGERIAALRNTYSLSRDALAERSGVPAGLLARMEDEGYIPDLAPLVKISRALGVRLGTLLDDHEELGPVVTRRGESVDALRFVASAASADDQDASAEGSGERAGLVFNSLASNKAGRHMEPFMVEAAPGADPRRSSHEGEEFLYILSGKAALEYGTHRYELEAGDSVYYDSIVPHRLVAAGSEGAKVLAVVYAPL